MPPWPPFLGLLQGLSGSPPARAHLVSSRKARTLIVSSLLLGSRLLVGSRLAAPGLELIAVAGKTGATVGCSPLCIGLLV